MTNMFLLCFLAAYATAIGATGQINVTPADGDGVRDETGVVFNTLGITSNPPIFPAKACVTDMVTITNVTTNIEYRTRPHWPAPMFPDPSNPTNLWVWPSGITYTAGSEDKEISGRTETTTITRRYRLVIWDEIDRYPILVNGFTTSVDQVISTTSRKFELRKIEEWVVLTNWPPPPCTNWYTTNSTTVSNLDMTSFVVVGGTDSLWSVSFGGVRTATNCPPKFYIESRNNPKGKKEYRWKKEGMFDSEASTYFFSTKEEAMGQAWDVFEAQEKSTPWKKEK